MQHAYDALKSARQHLHDTTEALITAKDAVLTAEDSIITTEGFKALGVNDREREAALRTRLPEPYQALNRAEREHRAARTAFDLARLQLDQHRDLLALTQQTH